MGHGEGICGKSVPFRENSLKEELKERNNYVQIVHDLAYFSQKVYVQKGYKSEYLNV